MSDGQKSNSPPRWAGLGQDELQEPRRRAVDVVLATALAAGTVAIAANLLQALRDPAPGSPSRWTWSGAMPLLAATLVVLALTLFRRTDVRLRAGGLLLLGYAAGIYSLATVGPVGGGTLLLLALPALGLSILGVRAGAVMAGASLLLYAVFTLLAAGGRLAGWPAFREDGPELARWLGHGLWFVVLLPVLVGVQATLSRGQNRAWARERRAAGELAGANEELAGANEELARRGEQLDRKVRFLEATTAVARDLAAAHDGQELLQRAVRLAVERLEFDGAAIYLLDERPEGSSTSWPDGPAPVLAAGSVSGGPLRPAAGYGSLGSAAGSLRDEGALARLPGAVSQALARKTAAVEASPPGGPSCARGYDLAIPLSPGPGGTERETPGGSTRMGRPEPDGQAFRHTARIIGVLLLHSPGDGRDGAQAAHAGGEAPAALEVADLVAPLEAMAGQLAATLERLRLLSEARVSLGDLEARYRHYAGEAWQTPGEKSVQPAHRWQAPGAPADGRPTADPDWDPLFAEARATGEPVVGLDSQQGVALVAVPIKLRDVPIGVVGFYRDAAVGPWLPEQIASVQAVAERVALAAENLRLLGATRRRATHDRVLAEVTAHMRRSLDIDAVLQAGVREMRQALAIPEVEIWLDVPEVPGPRISAPADGLAEGEVEG